MELKDIFINIVIPLLGIVIAHLASWYGVKVEQKKFENSIKATPSELLRLEKWSTILKDLGGYPCEIKNNLDIDAISNAYNFYLSRATLENKVMDLGIIFPEFQQELLCIKPGSGDKKYPTPSWRVFRWKDFILYISIILILGYIFIFLMSNIFIAYEYGLFGLFLVIIVVDFLFVVSMIDGIRVHYIRKNNSYHYMRDITFRNGYRALKYVYLAPGVSDVVEDEVQEDQRNNFEKHRRYGHPYRIWKKSIKDDHPDWSSWNYGLNIDWNNDPTISPIEYYI